MKLTRFERVISLGRQGMSRREMLLFPFRRVWAKRHDFELLQTSLDNENKVANSNIIIIINLKNNHYFSATFIRKARLILSSQK